MAYIPYVPTVWRNDVTKVNETNMNNIEKGIKDLEEYTDEEIFRVDSDITTTTNTLTALINKAGVTTEYFPATLQDVVSIPLDQTKNNLTVNISTGANVPSVITEGDGFYLGRPNSNIIVRSEDLITWSNVSTLNTQSMIRVVASDSNIYVVGTVLGREVFKTTDGTTFNTYSFAGISSFESYSNLICVGDLVYFMSERNVISYNVLTNAFSLVHSNTVYTGPNSCMIYTPNETYDIIGVGHRAETSSGRMAIVRRDKTSGVWSNFNPTNPTNAFTGQVIYMPSANYKYAFISNTLSNTNQITLSNDISTLSTISFSKTLSLSQRSFNYNPTPQLNCELNGNDAVAYRNLAIDITKNLLTDSSAWNRYLGALANNSEINNNIVYSTPASSLKIQKAKGTLKINSSDTFQQIKDNRLLITSLNYVNSEGLVEIDDNTPIPLTYGLDIFEKYEIAVGNNEFLVNVKDFTQKNEYTILELESIIENILIGG